MEESNSSRILEGLTDAARMAACDHNGALPFTTELGTTAWTCPACRGRFSQNPRNLSERHAEIQRRFPKTLEALNRSELLDKIDGLEAELREAVRVAYRRGAVEWARLNYPKWEPGFAAEMRQTLGDEGTRDT